MGLKDRMLGDGAPGEPSEDGEVGLPDRGIGYFKRKLLEEVDLAEIAKLGPSQRRARLESRGRPSCSAARARCSPPPSAARLIRQIVDEALGLGMLEPLLADETITEIMVNGPDEICVERARPTCTASTPRFTNEAQLIQTIDRIVSHGQPPRRRVQPDGRRAPAHRRARQRDHPAAGARRARCSRSAASRARSRSTSCVRMGTVDPDTADLLRALVRARMSIVVSGGTGSGKTTLLNALSGFIPAERADRHHRGHRRAAAAAAARGHARGAPAQRRGQGPGHASATSCATRCACAPTASSSARSAAPRRSTCCRR